MVHNIDPIYLLVSITVIAFSFGPVLYWYFKKKAFTRWILLYSFIAYFGAIALKYIVQIPTIAPFRDAVGGNPAALGAYYGLQTVIFEIGGAYLVARYGVRRGQLHARDAEGYGLGLGLWENGVYLGIVSLINLVSYYAILSSGPSSLSQLVYNALIKSSPDLFLPPAQALSSVGFGILERFSSLLAHFSWGYLAVMAIVFRRRLFLALALPLGLIDFLVPFAGILGVPLFELIIFVISFSFLIIALFVTRKVRKQALASISSTNPITEPLRQGEQPQSSSVNTATDNSPKSLVYMNFRRSISYGKVYFIMGIVLSAIFSATIAASIQSAATSSPQVNPSIVSQIPALSIPLGALIGSLGGLMIFASDKAKGVYEYLIAYGVNVSSIFWSIVLATTGLVSIILVISVSMVVGVLVALGVPITYSFIELLIFYVIPMSYTSTMFMSMAGMIWTSLTTRRAGLNSPVGAAPILGIVPMLVVVFLSSKVGPGNFILLAGSVSIALLISVGSMVAVSGRKMVRERFLSNA
ncbi:MAG TPA: YhfC family glutamic-type intramembrane protease [Nitrososphaerales archaeon]|nr:YhfC family glutamic-type intramembrane protease [Nitrososphaerales archaeon]